MQVSRHSKLTIPDSLRTQLLAFRRRVWSLKMFEAVAAAVIGILIGYLVTYALDRFVDTPPLVRGFIFASAVLACGWIPFGVQKWILRRRHMDQLARLLSETDPAAGDRLLGILELSEDAGEQSRSPELVQAAIQQVAADVDRRDLSSAVPNPQHRQRGIAAGLLLVVALALSLGTNSAATNAWLRFLAPWKKTPRYTFAAIEPLPDQLIVPHGESFPFSIRLGESTDWEPATAEVTFAGQLPVRAPRSDRRYEFSLPPQIAPRKLGVRVGDYKGEVPLRPMLRPELSSLRGEIELPAYLGRDPSQRRDIRGATISIVKGSRATFQATVSRQLATATVNGKTCVPQADHFSTHPIAVDGTTDVELQWEDRYGLSAQKPFRLTIEAASDEPPSLVCEKLPLRRVLLDSEVLSFRVRARDDFGVKRVGIEWQGLDNTVSHMAAGEKIIGAGDHQAEVLELAATFCARDHDIEPQPLALRVFAEDYLPNRQRVYWSTCTLDVLDPQQHAIWITSELNRWHRMSLDVRDRELQLHETNKRLRRLPIDELADPQNRRKLARQADNERVNGRRLMSLVRNGEALLSEAMRNPDIGVGHLDTWAEMMKVLKDISANRMPEVADLLKEASQSPQPASQSPSEKALRAGKNRLTQNPGSGPAAGKDPDKPSASVPSVTDIESTHQDLSSAKPGKTEAGKPKQPRLTLPDTMLAGTGNSGSNAPSRENKVEQAVRKQQDLLTEFKKVAGELDTVLANLEGSTLVKRLKASSRRQQHVASKLASLASNSFGVADREKDADADAFAELAEVESLSSQDTSHIMDDMAAYFERSRLTLFRRVLDDMRQQDVTAGLRQLGDELRRENGLSISQAEYWSDAFDRWAEDLVEVTRSGACPGSKAKGSLPPSLVLEVLQLLEGEVKLREQTRVAEQARPAVTDTEHMTTANQLSQTQDGYQKRVDQVVKGILALPDAEADFANELEMLSQVSAVMAETTEILAKPETGRPAIAAETEIIELLLKSKRFNPNASGGGGSQPGGGGSGDTQTPALALVGAAVGDNEVPEETSTAQATGTTGPGLPEEFRSGLDQYFNRLDTWKTEPK